MMRLNLIPIEIDGPIGFFYFHGLQTVVAVFELDDIAVGSAHTIIIPDAVVLDVLHESPGHVPYFK